jgi:hypothetical protein
LLHTWSLAVEEQFYILFPIFLYIILRFYKNFFLFILCFIFLISFFFSIYFFRIDPNLSYYLLPTRIFEFILGSVIVYFEIKNLKKISKSILLKYFLALKNLFPFIGIILIFYSFIFLELEKISHPGLSTLIPLAGITLIIGFSSKKNLIKKILSIKILVFLGLISYSLYLWHYVIFAFYRNSHLTEYLQYSRVLIILILLLLSTATYYFIERPFRNRNIISFKKLIFYFFIFTVTLTGFSFYIIKNNGLKNRFPNILSEKLYAKKHEVLFNNEGELGNVVLIGDSHAGALEYYLNQQLRKNSYNFSSLYTNIYSQDFKRINRRTQRIDNKYEYNNKKIDNFLLENNNLIIIWNQRWSIYLLETRFDNEEGFKEFESDDDKLLDYYYQPNNIENLSLEKRQEYFEKNLKLTAKNILDRGHILILVYPVPEMAFDPFNLMKKKIIQNRIANHNDSITILSTSYDVYKKRNKKIIHILDNIHGKNVYRVYPDKIFCNTAIPNRCVANNAEHLFYFDSHHLSIEGSKYLVEEIIKILKNFEIYKK